MLSNREIVKQSSQKPISDITEKMNIDTSDLMPYGKEITKVHVNALKKVRSHTTVNKLILVSATTPTKAGEGKTTTSIGLAQGLKKLGLGNLPICIDKAPSSL